MLAAARTTRNLMSKWMFAAQLGCALLASVLCIHSVRAQRAPKPAPKSEAEARGLFLAGQAAYEEGRFEDALAHFREAHDKSGHPDLSPHR